MGQVVPFIHRVRDAGDWSADERARLEALGEQMAASGIDVEVIFGATDEGDPWCVVTDADGDVLIHVARIGGVFVVHSAVDDAVNESVDLHTALRERLVAAEDALAPRSATILPFEPRQAQTLLALVVAAAFFYETAGIGGAAQAAELPQAPGPPEDPPPAETHDADTPSHDREVIARAAALQTDEPPPSVAVQAEAPATAAAPVDAAPTLPTRLEPAAAEAAPKAAAPPAAPAEAAAPTLVIQGTDRDDSLAGTAGNEHILGGAGNDTLTGGGGHDTLDGGAGDDRIELDAGVVAIGGDGADTFVIIHARPAGHGGPPPPDAFFGVIFDFSSTAGDRVVNTSGATVRLTPRPESGGDNGGPTLGPPAPPSPADVQTATAGPTGLTPTTLTRVDVDLDNDGVNDGYLLVGRWSAPPPPAPDRDDPPPITVVGQSLPLDPFG